MSSLPLPASRALWEASTQESWQTEYDRMLSEHQGRPYLNYADLVTLSSVDKSIADPEIQVRKEELNKWYTTVDGFGVMIIMAASTFQ